MPSNPENKKQRTISRRKFLQYASLLGAGAVFGSSCQKEEQPTPTSTPTSEHTPTKLASPTVEPTIEPTKTQLPTQTPEPSPTIETISYQGTKLTKEFLVSAFSIGGGDEEVSPETFATPTSGEPVNPRMSMQELVEKYVAAGWDEELSFQGLTDNPVNVLKTLVSIGSYTGVKNGVYSPGGIDGQEVLPLLSGTTLLRVRLTSVPSEIAQQTPEVQRGVLPSGLTLRSNTDMTVIGKVDNFEEMDWTLVAFTDWFRASKEEKVAPKQYFALIPSSLPGDPDNKDAFTLQNLLAKEGFEFKNNQVSFTDSQGRNAMWKLNEVVDPELKVEVRESAGMFFVDQMQGELLANPVVPYPDEQALNLPEYWSAEKRVDKDNTTYFVITNLATTDEDPVDLAEARYDAKTKQWSWQKIYKEVEQPTWLPTVSNAIARFNDTESTWQYFSTDTQEKDQYIVSVKEGEAGYEFYQYAQELRPQLHPELFAVSTVEEIKATGQPKILFCDVTKVDKFEVILTEDELNYPYVLLAFFEFKEATDRVNIFYPYLKEGQANPSYPLQVIYFDSINTVMEPTAVIAMSSGFQQYRTMDLDELQIDRTGEMAKLGQVLLAIKTGCISFVGRPNFDDKLNRMTLDTFAKDPNGRILYLEQ